MTLPMAGPKRVDLTEAESRVGFSGLRKSWGFEGTDEEEIWVCGS